MSCEHANRALSGIHFNSTATHARFEDKCGVNIRKTTEPVNTVLRDAKLPKNQVHEVELAGDSERFHNVRQLLSYFFNGTEPTKLINSAESMAYGETVVETMPSGNDSSENLQSRYKPALVAFMSFKDGVNYSADMNFSEQARLNITPELLCRWMNHRAYGSEQPTKDMKPTHARSSTLELYKKAISSFMPRLTIPWDNVRHEGNPTRSEAINQLIKTVKRFEVRREGVLSSARRSIEYCL
ncbi:hypothetical protein F441_22259 [Phytophthora nicotianae CJ01A1]|uniref:Uncharacterized protein n=1 Tax=Phytophthora nicotianae CJ01A1 TaxID=1317063 RepID=W2VSI3_PHYNI|nr:hypothetical protein F441_22259 [Phytophthora nicotianae CJ01A1]